jgi:quinol monooxygenase YgiN
MNLRRLFCFLSSAVLMASTLGAQNRGPESADTAAYTVSYIEVAPASRTTTLAEFKQYRETSRKDQGFVRMEFFEQVGRPGHFVIIETWNDQKASDAHGAAAHTKQLFSKLQPVRLSDYDQRPYKTLAVGPVRTAPTNALFVITHVDVGGPAGAAPDLLKRLAEASRKEDGNLRFDLLLHTMRANHFTVIEAWKDLKALDAHAAASHTRQYRDGLQPLLGSPLDERLYKVVE